VDEVAVMGAPTLVRFVARRPGAAANDEVASEVAVPIRRNRDGNYPAEFGQLAELVADSSVTDVFVNGRDGAWVDRGVGLERVPAIRLDEPELRELAVRLMSLGGRHIDEATPCVDARLEDGIRVHAVLPPISPTGTLLSVRLPRIEFATLDFLEENGFFAAISRRTIDTLVVQRANLLITGAGGSGKTTFLSALLASASPHERIIAIEDVAELRVRHPHYLALEARQPNLEGAGALGLERLVREALRMRPDRLVLGECRGAELRELLAALNTGHDGGAGTLHANSLEDVPARLEALGALAGMSPVAVARQTVSAIGTVLHVERSPAGRRLAQMGSFVLDHRDRLAIRPTANAAIGIAAAEVAAAGIVPTAVPAAEVAA
jgi:pilus assembly protein CpaF